MSVVGSIPSVNTQKTFACLSSGTAFANPLAGQLSNATAMTANYALAVPVLTLFGVATEGLASLDNINTSFNTTVGALQAHSEQIISNVSQNMNIAASATTASNAIGSTLNSACAIFNDVFAGIGQLAATALTGMQTAMNDVSALLNAAAIGVEGLIGYTLAKINGIITTAVGAVALAAAAVTSVIAGAVGALANAIANIAHVSFAVSLPNLLLNPCVSSLVSSVATPALINAIRG